MRDTIKDKNYFEKYIQNSESSYNKRTQKLKDGNIAHNRIQPVKIDMIRRLIKSIGARYSLGMTTEYLIDDLTKAIDLVHESWAGYRKLIGKNQQVLDQYSLDAYDEMLWMLSLGYLLNIPIAQFNKLVDAIDEDKVKDKLFEFIISSKIPSRPKLEGESYTEGWELFGKLREVIDMKNKQEASLLVKSFLEKDWYKEHKNANWYNNHKNKFDTYSGYWSFETAAIVKILDLNDRSFKTNEYYPKDLIVSEPC